MVFLNFCELGGANQKMLVSNLEELKKIGEVCFGVLSIALMFPRKLNFCEKFAKILVSGVAPRKKMM